MVNVATKTPLGPMPQLKLNVAGKPSIPKWIPPPATKEYLEWASLRTLDLALLDGSPEDQAALVETCRAAIQEDGFLYLQNFGVSEEVMQRAFDLAQYCCLGGGMTETDKDKLEWQPKSGSFKGFKKRGGWGEKGKKDQIEHMNWYEENLHDMDQFPPGMLPFIDEIKAYADHMHNQVNRRLAVLFARILGLPDDYVWDKVNTKGGILGETSYFRYQIYHAFDPKDYEDAELIMHGHTDYGVATLLASQPITCLQMLDRHGKWRYIKYEPHRYLVNLGDALEVVSGGQFKATRHKVVKPPRDQMQYTRIALISFCHAWRNLRLEPLNDSPLIKEKGLNKESEVFGAFCRRLENGLEVPTFGEWKSVRTTNAQAPPEKIVFINGRKHKEQAFNGTTVFMPI